MDKTSLAKKWRDWRGLAITLVIVVAVGVVLLVVSVALSDSPKDLWLELGRAGVQLLVIGVLGGLLTVGWQGVERRRASAREDQAKRLQDDHERHDRMLAAFLHVLSAYNGVKAVRRTLRSLGFEDTSDGAIDAWQAEGFHREMQRLSDFQLEFEAIAIELGESRIFADDTDQISEQLRRIEQHLNRVIGFWEHEGSRIRSGFPRNRVAAGVSRLISYPDFMRGVVEARRLVADLMHQHLFGLATPAQLKTLRGAEDDLNR